MVTGTNLTIRKAVYFQRHDFPDMSVLDALMISSCVPFVFPYIQFQGDMYVDGFVTDNFPIFRLDIHGNPLIAHANDLESIVYEVSACYINSLKENPRKG